MVRFAFLSDQAHRQINMNCWKSLW